MSALALFGGEPVRKKPYPAHDTMIGPEEEREGLEVLRSGNLSGFSARWGDRFWGGPKVLALEDVFKAHYGVPCAVSFNSGTSALHAAIAALRPEPGDEIITSPFTMSGTAAAILSNLCVPVFADIETGTYGLDPASVRAYLSERTRAILTVNLFGHPSCLDELKAIADEARIPLIEDNAQAPGAVYKGRWAGTVGKIGVQSLNYHKCIQTGEGGVALTRDEALAQLMRLVRNHGEAMDQPLLGGNLRMTELSAAVGVAQMGKLTRLTEIRQRLAHALTQALRGMDFLEPPATAAGCTHVYYLYPMKYRPEVLGLPRHTFARAMRAEGVAINEGYSQPLYHQFIYRKRKVFRSSHAPWSLDKHPVAYHPRWCPNTESMWRDVLLTTDICKYPNTEADVAEFAEAARKVADNVDELRRKT